MSSQKDTSIKTLLNNADLSVPDGIGIVIASKINGNSVKQRVTGIDLMNQILGCAKTNGWRVFLLGSAPGVAENAAIKMTGVSIAGTHHGYFKENDERAIVSIIKNSKPDILFVGLGSPRQEQFLTRYYKEMGAAVNMVIGGSLDVISGSKTRAPRIVQKLNIEWLYRLFQEPKRWRRQVSLVTFILTVIKSNFTRRV